VEKGLRFCQFQKKNNYYSGIKQSPFEALFSREAQLGLISSALPNILKTLNSENDLQQASSSLELINDELTKTEISENIIIDQASTARDQCDDSSEVYVLKECNEQAPIYTYT